MTYIMYACGNQGLGMERFCQCKAASSINGNHMEFEKSDNGKTRQGCSWSKFNQFRSFLQSFLVSWVYKQVWMGGFSGEGPSSLAYASGENGHGETSPAKFFRVPAGANAASSCTPSPRDVTMSRHCDCHNTSYTPQ